MQKLTVFIVDDERILRITIADDLRDAGHAVYEFANGSAALSMLNSVPADIVITDLMMPGMDGIEFLKKVKQFDPEITVIVMTAFASVQTAIQSLKCGAYDYITKPFEVQKILLMLERICEIKQIKQDNYQLRAQLENKFDFSSFVGSSSAIKEIFKSIELVAKTSTTILINGQTGTGKEMLTNIIHYNSNRKKMPFIKVNCAVLSKEIFESELFGHEKGAFTGADKEKTGRFELADKGTLYMDDVDDIPYDLQVKLLRAIEQQEIERVGGSHTIKIDVRLIASTKANLRDMVSQNKFREDLFYRLNVFPITIPPLSERKEDIPELVNHFLKLFCPDRKITVDASAMDVICNYRWKGNVRELKNLIERLVLLTENDRITMEIIPMEFKSVSFPTEDRFLLQGSLSEMVEVFEKNVLKQTLDRFAGNKTKAAEYLATPLSTLRSKLIKYNFE